MSNWNDTSFPQQPGTSTYWNDTNVGAQNINPQGFYQPGAGPVDSSFGGGDLFGALDSKTTGPNGSSVTNRGWGGLALGVGNMYMNYTQGKAQQKMAREQLDFSKEQFYKNYAMNMDKYRRRVNRESAGLAHAGTGGAWSDTASRFNDGSQILDERGQVVADPTYGAVEAGAPAIQSAFAPQAPVAPQTNAVSAFAPTAAANNFTGGMNSAFGADLNLQGTGTETVLTDPASKRRARRPADITPTSDADDKKAANVDKAINDSSDKKKNKKITG